MKPGLINILFVVFSLTACDNGTTVVDLSEVSNDALSVNTGKAKDVYLFGFDIRRGPHEDARQYLPLLKYLESETGYRFKLSFSTKDKSSALMLGENRVQFAALGATSYIKAKTKYPVVSLVRGLNTKGQSKYQSFLVALPESDIEQVADVRGRKVAFGSRDSTQGHLIPRIIMMEHGIYLRDLADYIYTGSHRNCVEAVLSKKAEACGMQDTLAKEMINKRMIKLIHKSKFYPSSGIATNKSVPERVRSAVKKALLRFKPNGKHKSDLYNWHLTEMPLGFESSSESDYVGLQEWMRELGMLN